MNLHRHWRGHAITSAPSLGPGSGGQGALPIRTSLVAVLLASVFASIAVATPLASAAPASVGLVKDCPTYDATFGQNVVSASGRPRTLPI